MYLVLTGSGCSALNNPDLPMANIHLAVLELTRVFATSCSMIRLAEVDKRSSTSAMGLHDMTKRDHMVLRAFRNRHICYDITPHNQQPHCAATSQSKVCKGQKQQAGAMAVCAVGSAVHEVLAVVQRSYRAMYAQCTTPPCRLAGALTSATAPQ